MLDAVKRLLLREARERPVLLIFEALHWIDSKTQALIDGLGWPRASIVSLQTTNTSSRSPPSLAGTFR